jgi:ATP-dependent Clp protease ATP-binding subunit ClpX
VAHTKGLDEEDLVRIIKEPKNSIMRQYQKLAYIDGKKLTFTDDAIEIIAKAAMLSETGARGIRSIIETVLNDFMFDIYDYENTELVVDGEYCKKTLSRFVNIEIGNKLKKAV